MLTGCVLVKAHVDVERWAGQPDSDPGKLAVAMSALLPTTRDATWYECAQLETCYEKALPSGGPPLADLLRQTDQEFADFAPVLKIANPSKSLTEVYAEVAAAAS